MWGRSGDGYFLKDLMVLSDFSKNALCNALLKIKINERLQATKPIIFWDTAENALYEGRQGILLDLKEFTLYYGIALVWQADERVLSLKSENLGSDFRFRHVLAVWPRIH